MRSARVYTERSRSGFTLVELLVVIAIIAILSSIGLTIYTNAQKNARISKRVQDLKAIEAALEIYYNASNAYPISGAGTPPAARSECAVDSSRTPDQVIPGLTPNFMSVFPADPRMDAANNVGCYRYLSDGVDYKLYTHNVTEMTSADFGNQRGLVDPRRDGGPLDDGTNCDHTPTGTISAWAIYTNGARCW